MPAKAECVMYCRSWCGDCHRAIEWLDAAGIEYRLVDIELVPGAADRVRELAGKIVTPTFEVGDEVVVSFDERRLGELLG
jgi:glutaredoxin